jgi:glycosyltransferase involved in cell wall biosynthesis
MRGPVNSVRGPVKRLVRSVADRADARSRRLPRLRVSPVPVGRPAQVYYLCPDTDVPTGGVRVIYRHVDLLNAAGIPAAVVHERAGFSCTWFRHETKILSTVDVTVSAADILVVPEYYRPSPAELPTTPRVVIFNQNTYRTFAVPGSADAWRRYAESDNLAAIAVVSQDNAEYARYAFPSTRVACIRNSVDGELFRPAEEPPGRRVAYMPRRREADARQVLDLLAIRGCLEGWDVVRIDGRSEEQTAADLRSCSIFLSFSAQEGFGMPPAEAMASGCFVIGFTGLAGREFFDQDICSPVEEGDVLAFAKATEQVMASFDKNAGSVLDRGLAAAERIHARYSMRLQSDELTSFYGSMIH